MKPFWHAEPGKLSVTSITEFVPFARERPRRVHLVGYAGRPGLLAFYNSLEYLHFDPEDTLKNRDFEFSMFEWENVDWMVATIPSE